MLFDRYASTRGCRCRPAPAGAPACAAALLARSLPAPDLTIVLDAPVEVLLGRRDEHPAEVIEAQRTRYAELARSARDGVVVDASADAGGPTDRHRADLGADRGPDAAGSADRMT